MKKIGFIFGKVGLLKVLGISLCICTSLFLFTAPSNGQFYYPYGYQQSFNPYDYQQSYSPYYASNYGWSQPYGSYSFWNQPMVNQLIDAFGGLNQPFGDSSFNIIGPQNSLIWCPHIPELNSLFYPELGEPRLSYPYAYGNNSWNQPYGYNLNNPFFAYSYYDWNKPAVTLWADLSAVHPSLLNSAYWWASFPTPGSLSISPYPSNPWLQQAKIPSIPPPQLLHIYDELGYAREDY